jgi:uncharacterized protein (TIGR02453 family)
MAKATYFTPALFSWLRQLKKNNNREWFQQNRDRYLETVRDPLLRFIADFGPRLETISPHFLADPRPSGGSMFRIHRDTRFSKDKSPYKTHAAAQFRHQAGKDVHAPGFYLHLEPGEAFVGGGIWHPDAKALAGIRELIVDDPAGWKKSISGKGFRDGFALGGESLKRPPRGFDSDHPLIEELKRKDYVASTRFSEEEVCAPGFLDTFARACRTMGPFVRYLTRGVQVPF